MSITTEIPSQNNPSSETPASSGRSKKTPLQVILDSLKPRGPLLTPLNIVISIILLVGAVLSVQRFGWGIGAVAHPDDTNPWGIWIGFNVMAGVALAAGGYTIGAAVHIFRMEKFAPIARPAILMGFLGYVFVIVGLLYDLGRPYRLPYPMMVSFGTTSVLFLVGWHFALYLNAQAIEVAPALFEWLGLKKLRALALKLSLPMTIFGVVLAMLHQAALGGLFLLAPWKLHPLWFSSYLPTYFFVSSVFAGLAVVILESSLSHRYFSKLMDEDRRSRYKDIQLGLAKGASLVMLLYLGIKVAGIMYDNEWALLTKDFYGYWFLLESLGFVALPCAMFAVGYRQRNVILIRVAAVLTVLGIVLNRINVSMIAFNHQLPVHERHIPGWKEIWIAIAVVTMCLVCFRWIANRWPIFWQHPDFEPEH